MLLRWQHIFSNVVRARPRRGSARSRRSVIELQPHFLVSQTQETLSYQLTGASRPDNCRPATLGRTRPTNKRKHKDFSYWHFSDVAGDDVDYSG